MPVGGSPPAGRATAPSLIAGPRWGPHRSPIQIARSRSSSGYLLGAPAMSRQIAHNARTIGAERT